MPSNAGTIGIAVVGYGYWGPNVARNFSGAPGAELRAVCDVRPERLAIAQARHPQARAVRDAAEVFADPGIDAVVIATAVSSHFDLARRALAAGKHVLVEKPLTSTADEARRLIDEAGRRGLQLAVDHTFAYTGAVRRIRELVRGGALGRVHYYDSVRVNLGLFQHDVSVLWDLAVHDLAILDYVLEDRAEAVSATGMSHVPGQPENVAYLTLFFPERRIAHVHVNWLAPVKVRRTLIGGSEKMIVYDELEPSEKVKIYDKGLTFGEDPEGLYQMRIGYRTGDMWAPRLDTTEALRVEADEFVRAIRDGAPTATDGAAGLRVVEVLEAATRSMAERGRPVPLP
ncbi:MAG: Gfo/Idh/MocA family oxidoreductase [Vicinamibacteria bacterium]